MEHRKYHDEAKTLCSFLGESWVWEDRRSAQVPNSLGEMEMEDRGVGGEGDVPG